MRNGRSRLASYVGRVTRHDDQYSRRKTVKEFFDGFICGVKETPRAFFAPAVALWRVLLETTEQLIATENKSREVE